jgi:hypothetical protein
VRDQLLLIDGGIALVLVAIVLVLSPGPAVTGPLALIVIVACAIGFVRSRRPRRRSARRPRRGRR